MSEAICYVVRDATGENQISVRFTLLNDARHFADRCAMQVRIWRLVRVRRVSPDSTMPLPKMRDYALIKTNRRSVYRDMRKRRESRQARADRASAEAESFETDGTGWVPCKSEPCSAGVCVCGAHPSWIKEGRLRCNVCVPLATAPVVSGAGG